ncbi:MAG: GTPase Era [bacterium]
MFKAGYISLVGKPNVGKSTLMNTLLKEKVSSVTPKPQTTRHQILGILNLPDVQAIFIDTPGLMARQKDKLDERMVGKARSAIMDSDISLLMVEPYEKEIISDFFKRENTILAINKIDKISKPDLLPLIEYYNNLDLFLKIIPISAKKGINCDSLLFEIISLLPLHPPFYDTDILSTHPERFFVEEIIKEKIFLCYGDEIPYDTAVVVEEFKEREDGKDYIRAIIYVNRTSQKGILIGKKGEALKRIGERARKEIEAFHNKPVYLELIVKEKRDWRKKDKILNEFGY